MSTGISIVQVQINESTDRIITGTYIFDRDNGGILVIGSGSSFPISAVTPGEIFWRTDLQALYRRNDSNTEWELSNGLPVGPAGGDLDGYYPNPTVANFTLPNQISGSISYCVDGYTWTTLDPPPADGYILSFSSGVPEWTIMNLGDVVGPSTATDNAIARFDGTTGKLIKNSIVTIENDGYTSIPNLNVTGNIHVTGTVDGVDISSHASRHVNGGADQLDGYNTNLNYNPTSYTVASNVIGQHIAALDGYVRNLTKDHGLLTGLADDDHTQYLLTNGTRSMSGNLNMGGNAITNVTTVDGYNLESIFSGSQGAILYRDVSGWTQLPAGQDGYVLTANGVGSNPAWEINNIPQRNILYVGKHGSDTNTGTSIDLAFLTFTAAITKINTLSPSASNPYSIVCFDDGIYNESLTIPSFVVISAGSAYVNGNHILNDSSGITIGGCVIVSGTGFSKTSGTSAALVRVSSITCSGTANGATCTSGTLIVDVNSCSVVNGTGFGGNTTQYLNVRCASIIISGSGYGIGISGAGICNFSGVQIVGASGRAFDLSNNATINANVGLINCSSRWSVSGGSIFNLNVAELAAGTETNNGTVHVSVAGQIRETGGPTYLTIGSISDGQVLIRSGSTVVGSSVGSGDVVGPNSSTDNALVRFDGTTGKLIQNSNAILDNTGNLSIAGYLDVSAITTPTYQEGRIFYDSNDKTLAVMMSTNGVTQQIGQEIHIYARNITGSPIANGAAVYINGATGNRPTIALADADIDSSSHIIGITTQAINNTENGYVTAFGYVRDLNTNAWNAGDMLYLSGTAGQLTNVKPTGTSNVVFVGIVITKGVADGIIFVNIRSPEELADLHDVDDGTPVDGYYLRGNGTYWTRSEFSADVANNPYVLGSLLTNGTRAMSSNLNMGGNAITNVTTVDGYNLESIFSGSQGSILYKDVSGWTHLPPGQDGYVLTTNGPGANPEWAATGTSSQSVTGPLSSTNNAIARFDGVTGAIIKNSNVTIADDGYTDIPNLNVTGNIYVAGMVDGVDVSSHALRHVNGGADQLDGYNVNINYSPVSYSVASNVIGQHIAALDGYVRNLTKDHGLLTGLTDDDHTQYLLTNGARAMGGSLNMGGNAITNVTTVDGYNLESIFSGSQGSILYKDVSGWTQLPPGQDGYILSTNGAAANPEWILDKGEFISQLTKEPSGFETTTTATISIDDSTRTFSITPVSGSFSFYIHGVQFTKFTTQSVVFPDLEGVHFFYFDATGTLQTTQDSEPWVQALLGDGALVSANYWDADNNVSIVVVEERHGFMNPEAHLWMHNAFSTQWISGGSLSDFTIGTGSNNADAYFSVSSVTIYDEDLRFTHTDGYLQDMYPVAKIPIYYKSGVNGYWRRKTSNAFPIIYSGTAGYTGANGRLPYNSNLLGTWGLTQVANGNFVLMHYYATNSLYEPIIGVQGITEYGTLLTAVSGAETELLTISGVLGSLFKEITPLGTVIYQSATTYSNIIKGRIVQPSAGTNYIDFRGNVFRGGTTSGITDHGLLTGLADDDHNQYLLIDGTRAMTGSLNLGGNALTNVSTVDGYNLESIFSGVQGSILYKSASEWTQLPPGQDGYVLTTGGSGANPSWDPTLTLPTNAQDGYITIALGGNLSYYRGPSDGYVLTWDEGIDKWIGKAVAKRLITVEFCLTEDVNNTTEWFTTWRGHGGDSPSTKRSGTSSGIQNANSCSPYQVPFNSKIIKATLTVKGVGVQNGSVTYPVSYQTDLFDEGFTSETKLADIDFSISNSYTVGTYSVGSTDYKGSTPLNIDVNEGDMLGLKFINGNNASIAGQTRNAFITLVLEER